MEDRTLLLLFWPFSDLREMSLSLYHMPDRMLLPFCTMHCRVQHFFAPMLKQITLLLLLGYFLSLKQTYCIVKDCGNMKYGSPYRIWPFVQLGKRPFPAGLCRTKYKIHSATQTLFSFFFFHHSYPNFMSIFRGSSGLTGRPCDLNKILKTSQVLFVVQGL